MLLLAMTAVGWVFWKLNHLAKNIASLNKVASKDKEFCLKEVGSILHLSDKHSYYVILSHTQHCSM